jgi:hypothetical protein
VYWYLFSEVLPLQTVELLWSPKAQESISVFLYKDKSALNKVEAFSLLQIFTLKAVLRNLDNQLPLDAVSYCRGNKPSVTPLSGLKTCSDRDFKKR